MTVDTAAPVIIVTHQNTTVNNGFFEITFNAVFENTDASNIASIRLHDDQNNEYTYTQNDSIFTVTGVPPLTALYITLTKTNGLSATAHITTTGNVTAVHHHTQIELRLYPNPASHQISLQFGDNGSVSYSYEIYSIQGRSVTAPSMLSPQKQIDCSHLPAGVYILKVRDTASGQSAIQRFSIVR